MSEPFMVGKFFRGFFDFMNLPKAIVQAFWISIVLLFVFLLGREVIKLKDNFFNKKPAQAPFTVNVCEGSTVKEVKNSNDQKKSEYSLVRVIG